MERRRRSLAVVGLAAATLLLLAACAAGVNPDVGSPPPGAAEPAGFWLGLWHGIILPVTWIVSLFTDTVSPYEVFNSGNWYDFGFVLGITIVFGGPFGASKAGRR
ncbi:hypothetical protein [Cellulomonas hominis]|uniref:hypothetical protein n=1 Tax=Cellulomonas hominis TaxID=156981 RepID=UPI00144458D3|nr:hypothetical protein [Cellulomonas hominis]NKY08876.1 hypothetical protein [Cellulomonas hominis]